jgi:hypothetical protein
MPELTIAVLPNFVRKQSTKFLLLRLLVCLSLATLTDMESEPVLPSAITFSDSKIRDSETGKLTLIGVFHQIKTTEVPFVSPPFFATVFITNFRGSIRDLPVRMEILNKSGQTIAKSSGHVSATEKIALREVAEMSFPIPSIRFDVAGHYQAVVFIDEEQIGSRGLNVTI